MRGRSQEKRKCKGDFGNESKGSQKGASYRISKNLKKMKVMKWFRIKLKWRNAERGILEIYIWIIINMSKKTPELKWML